MPFEGMPQSNSMIASTTLNPPADASGGDFRAAEIHGPDRARFGWHQFSCVLSGSQKLSPPSNPPIETLMADQSFLPMGTVVSSPIAHPHQMRLNKQPKTIFTSLNQGSVLHLRLAFGQAHIFENITWIIRRPVIYILRKPFSFN